MSRVVPLPQRHTHKSGGDADMEKPIFVFTEGNTTIKIRSALPFMTPDEQRRWWEENKDHPTVRTFKRTWAESEIAIAEREAAANEIDLTLPSWAKGQALIGKEIEHETTCIYRRWSTRN